MVRGDRYACGRKERVRKEQFLLSLHGSGYRVCIQQSRTSRMRREGRGLNER